MRNSIKNNFRVSFTKRNEKRNEKRNTPPKINTLSLKNYTKKPIYVSNKQLTKLCENNLSGNFVFYFPFFLNFSKY
jgi:hypothetical protein